MQEGHLTLKETADLLGVSRSMLFKLRQLPDFPADRPAGRRIFFSAAEVRAWQARREDHEAPAVEMPALPRSTNNSERRPLPERRETSSRRPTWYPISGESTAKRQVRPDNGGFSGRMDFRGGEGEIDLTIDIDNEHVSLIHSDERVERFLRRDVQFVRMTEQRTLLSLAGTRADFYPSKADEFVAALLRTRP